MESTSTFSASPALMSDTLMSPMFEFGMKRSVKYNATPAYAIRSSATIAPNVMPRIFKGLCLRSMANAWAVSTGRMGSSGLNTWSVA